VKGFVGYLLMRTSEGGISITVCQDKAGTDESVNIARDWASQLNELNCRLKFQFGKLASRIFPMYAFVGETPMFALVRSLIRVKWKRWRSIGLFELVVVPAHPS
jgi:hypothetical protein